MAYVIEQLPQTAAPAQGKGRYVVESTPDDEPGIAEDVLNAVPSGLARGVAGIVGLPEDIGTGMRWLNDQAKQLLGFEGDPDYVAGRGPFSGTRGPTSQDIIGGLETITGPLYQPETRAGKFAGTVSEFIPGAVAGPGGVTRNVLQYGVAPGLASEAAGQLSEGTRAEPYARIVGAMAGGTLPNLAKGGGPPLPPSAQDDIVAASQRLDVPLSTQDDIVAASQRLDVPIPRAALPKRPLQSLLAGKLSEIPILGTPLKKAAIETREGLGKKASEIAKGKGAPGFAPAAEGAKSGLRNWVEEESGDLMDALYSNVKSKINPKVTQPLNTTKKIVSDILGEQAASTTKGANPVIALVQEAIDRPRGLTYEGIQRLRTEIGERMSGRITPEAGTSQPALKRIYGALTDDLRAAAKTAGGAEGLKAWELANKKAAEIAKNREELTKIVGLKGEAPPNAVMDRIRQYASDTGKENIARLVRVKATLDKDAWNDMSAAIIGRLGRDRTQAADYFSPEKFLTEYSKLSDQGKAVLFGKAKGPLDDIATISRQHRGLAQLGNPSGTGGVVLTGAGLYSLPSLPFATLATVLTGYSLAHILAKPATARKVSLWAKARYNVGVNAGAAPRQTLLAASRDLADAIAEETGEKPEVIRNKLY